MAQIEIKNLTFFYPDMEKGEYLKILLYVILIWRYIEGSLWLYASHRVRKSDTFENHKAYYMS